MSSAIEAQPKYALGIDLGSASLGWAMIALDKSENPVRILNAGVRIFDPAVTGNIERGQDESNAVARRNARLVRRQLRRRAARQKELFQILQKHDLLPTSSSSFGDTSEQRHQTLNQLDKQLAAKWSSKSAGASFADLPLYCLRRAALYQPLDLYEIGRIVYHLSQRRGYKSNRREGGKPKKDDDTGKVVQGISDLQSAMGTMTLGEYFATLDPHAQKVRRRWTSRSMYEDEFARIWQAQSAHYPKILTEVLHREIKHLLFFQRPIKAQAHLIGNCELEPDQRRASWATLEAQRFRVLQKVNDLEVIYPGKIHGVPLTPEQRQIVFALLDEKGDQKFETIRKRLGLGENVGFNLQRGGDKTLRGNNVNKLMLDAFGDRWRTMPEGEKRRVIDEWRSIEAPESLKRHALSAWNICEEKADKLANTKAPDGYCNLSRKAINRLMPLLMEGVRFAAAKQQIPEYRPKLKEPLPSIPPVHEALPTLRNPAVERALTETRKVVNAIIAKYGKPVQVRVELARDLKKSRQDRAKITKALNEKKKERDNARALLREIPIQQPSRDDIEKVLLFQECGGICPYTGKPIEFSSLFGSEPQFDVEHIIPFSRFPDNSFKNKTLCYHEENRHVKGGKTPFEAYPDPETYAAILNRVRAWPVPNKEKQRRFELHTLEELEGFTNRRLTDTQYASRLACELISTLFGGEKVPNGDGTNRQVVFASSGTVTASLRKTWGLEAILREPEPSSNGQNKGKPRTDHRHHAIDAITIALTAQRVIQSLSRSASADPIFPQTHRAFRGLQCPWPDFVPSIRPHIERLITSHRPEHKLSGGLHKETIYGEPYAIQGKHFVNVRRSLSSLTAKQIENIVDEKIKAAVISKLAEHGGNSKLFIMEQPETLPFLTTYKGKRIFIKRVRVREAASLDTLRELPGNRFVEPNSIHHVEIFVVREHGRERWHGEVVDIMQAFERLRKKQPIVRRALDLGDGVEAEFLFSLLKGDTVEMNFQGARQLFRVKKFYSAGPIWFTGVNNAQSDDEQKRAKTTWSRTPNALKEMNMRKVMIDLLGKVHPAND